MAEDWGSDQPAVLETASIKLFGRWDLDEVNVNDISLTVSSVAVFLCWSSGMGMVVPRIMSLSKRKVRRTSRIQLAVMQRSGSVKHR